MPKTPIRCINDHLAQAWAEAKKLGDPQLADSLERLWKKAEVRCELAEQSSQQAA